MKGPTKNEREMLDNRLKWLERWLVFSGSVVVVGVFVEISSKVLNVRIDSEVIGGVLIMIGVAAEVSIARVISLKTDRIREIADLEIFRSMERAARAEQAAAEANLARSKIEQKLSDRTLSPSDFADIQRLLEPHQGMRIDITVFDHHIMEVVLFSEQIYQALATSGCSVKMWYSRDGARRITGHSLIFAVAHHTERELQNIANGLHGLFFAKGLDSNRSVGAFPFDTSSFTGRPFLLRSPHNAPLEEQAWSLSTMAPLRVQIGEKQLTPLATESRPVTPSQA